MSLSSIAQTLYLWTSRPWFAYLTLFLLQLKVVWGIWEYRDLTPGDTSFYYKDSYLWYKSFLINITYSPLYTAFYGTLMHFSSDAYLVTTLHRLIIILVLSLLVLVLMRRLLPHSLAWFAAAWWAILPTNYNALYEIHLFSIIPIVALWLLALRNPSVWIRSSVLAMLFAISILVRNELIVATCLLAIICLAWEFVSLRKQRQAGILTLRPQQYLLAYILPMIIAMAIIFVCYERSTIKFPELITANAKHTLNMCQVYAFGYQERHPGWQKSPWTECYGLMQSEFGKPLPTLLEMFKSNPQAVLNHIWWNVSLTPSGLQVLLFDSTWGTINPDYIEYIPLSYRSPTALLLTISALLIIFLGIGSLYYNRHYWWEYWLRERAFAWLTMFAVVSIAFVVIPTQRPRPAYLFALGIVLIALVTMSLFVIANHWPRLKRLSLITPFAIIVILALVPNHYSAWSHIRPRTLLEVYQRLTPFQDIIARPGTVFLKGDWYLEVPNYVGLGESKALDYSILNNVPANMPLEVFFEQQRINLFFADQNLLAQFEQNPLYQSFLNAPESFGWKLIGSQDTSGARWKLFQKTPGFAEDAAALQQLNARSDINPAADSQSLADIQTLPPDGLFVGHGWYALEQFDGATFRWVNNDAEIVVTAPTGARQKLKLDLIAGPGLVGQAFTLQVLDSAGQAVASADVQGRQTVSLPLPIAAGQPAIYRLHVAGGGQPTPNDPRILNFRVFKFEWDAQ